jgi:hypothetical protein
MRNGQQIGRENVAKLTTWLEANKDQLPVLKDGTLNKSRIAREAGLDRQIFTTNPAAAEVLARYGAPSNRPHLSDDVQASEMRRQKDAEISRLRDLLAKRELELSKLRQEVQAARQLRAMHETMVETMRHVKPPPGATT